MLLPRTRAGRLENEVQHYAEERALETMDDALGLEQGPLNLLQFGRWSVASPGIVFWSGLSQEVPGMPQLI